MHRISHRFHHRARIGLLGATLAISAAFTGAQPTSADLTNEHRQRFAEQLVAAGATHEGNPCRMINPLAVDLYTDPGTGHDLLVANSCTPGDGSNGSAVIIDTETGERWTVPFPNGGGGWDMREYRPGRVVFESLNPLHFVTVDLRTKRVVDGGVFPVENDPQPLYAGRMGSAGDGWVYHGSYPTGHVFRFNPDTRQYEDLGYIGQRSEGENERVSYVGVTSDGWVVGHSRLIDPHDVAVHVDTGERFVVEQDLYGERVTIDGELYVGISYPDPGGEGTIRGIGRFDPDVRRFEPVEEWKAPANVQYLGVLRSSRPGRIVLEGSDGVYYLIESDGAEPRPVWNLGLKGGHFVGVTSTGKAVGMRGQEYFVAEPMATSITLKRAAEDPPPVSMEFIRADPAGGIIGGPRFGQTLFRFDPARDLLENTSQVFDRNGEVTDARFVDGYWYFPAYAFGDLGRWDPDQPWNQWDNVNPKRVVDYGAKDLGEASRPQGGMVVGPRGCLFVGWGKRQVLTEGLLSMYCPETGEAKYWEAAWLAGDEPYAVGKVAANDQYVFGLSSNRFNGPPPGDKPTIFFVFDPVAEKVVFRQLISEQTEGASVAYLPGTDQAWVVTKHGFHPFDPQSLTFGRTIPWPNGTSNPGFVHSIDVKGTRLWVAAGNSIVELDASAGTPTTRIRLTAPGYIESLTAGLDGKLYFTQNVGVWSIPLND